MRTWKKKKTTQTRKKGKEDKVVRCPHMDEWVEFPTFCYYQPMCSKIIGGKCTYGKTTGKAQEQQVPEL